MDECENDSAKCGDAAVCTNFNGKFYFFLPILLIFKIFHVYVNHARSPTSIMTKAFLILIENQIYSLVVLT